MPATLVRVWWIDQVSDKGTCRPESSLSEWPTIPQSIGLRFKAGVFVPDCWTQGLFTPVITAIGPELMRDDQWCMVAVL